MAEGGAACTLLIMDPDAGRYAPAVARAHPGLRVLTAATQEQAVLQGGTADILAALAPFVSQAVIDAMPRLRWIQALTTGIDQLERLALPAGTLITSARGIHGPQMAELAFLHMIALSRDVPKMLANQTQARWQRWKQRLIFGKTAVLVGVGAISEELALRCQAFGMTVVGVSGARTEVRGFDRIVPRAALAEAAAEADFLIVLAPYTPVNHHLIDAAVLAAMRDGAFLINLARGSVVDEQALVAALLEGRIAGAGLDVFETEPLPADSALWSLPHVIVTPHIGGMSDIYAEQVLPLLIDNLGRYLSGQPERLCNLAEPQGAA